MNKHSIQAALERLSDVLAVSSPAKEVQTTNIPPGKLRENTLTSIVKERALRVAIDDACAAWVDGRPLPLMDKLCASLLWYRFFEAHRLCEALNAKQFSCAMTVDELLNFLLIYAWEMYGSFRFLSEAADV